MPSSWFFPQSGATAPATPRCTPFGTPARVARARNVHRPGGKRRQHDLNDWHDSADAHDDEDGDTGVNLTTYAFMKGADTAEALDITRPGSLAFVNAQGEITYLHEGRMDDTATILEKWNEATAAA